MILSLPPVESYRRRMSHANGWTDQYGALHWAAAYAGLTHPGNYFPAVWQHGCFGPWVDHTPGLLCYNAPGAMSLPVFVARNDQAELLQNNGYAAARAIGLPIVYVPEPTAARHPGSLLVMPTHSLLGSPKHLDRSPLERYVDEIAALKGAFSEIVVCVHPNCRENGLWFDEFSRRGIDVIEGARSDDRNALARMRALFAQFDAVTTNGWGSHVAYALAAGNRVSIYGTEVTLSEADCLRDATWAQNPSALANARSADTLARRDAYLRPLRVSPTSGIMDVAWGRELIGADNKLSPEAMRELFQDVRQAARTARAPRYEESCFLVEQLASGQTGSAFGRMGVCDITVDGVQECALGMQAPAQLTFELPTGASGQFASAVLVHPDDWHNPRTGPCEFRVRIDGRIAVAVVIDPRNIVSDRKWHELSIDVPANPRGTHAILLEAHGTGKGTCRALWREPSFSWSGEVHAVEAPASPLPMLAEAGESSLVTQARVAWKAKLGAGIALAEVGQGQVAIKMMLAAVKAVEACRQPQVIFDALCEVGRQLQPLDPARARHLLGLAVSLGRRLGTPEQERAARLLAEMPATAGAAGQSHQPLEAGAK